MKKKDTTRLVDDLVQLYGAPTISQVLDAFKDVGFHFATQAGVTISKNDVQTPPTKPEILARYDAELATIEEQYDNGEINQEERHELVTGLWDRATNEVGAGAVRPPRRAQPDLHDGQLRSPRVVLADPAAGRHARADGQPEGRDHRASDQGLLPGGPDRARVLHLDPRRPQGTRGHRAPHGGLGLPDTASGRRLPGRDHPPGGLRHRGVHRDAGVQARGRPRQPGAAADRRAQRQPDRADRRAGRHDQARSRDRREGQGDRPGRARRSGRGLARRHREGPRGHGARALGAQVRGADRRLPGLLRPVAGDRQAGPDRRRGRDHRRAVDRRAGHAADDAHVSHGRVAGADITHGLPRVVELFEARKPKGLAKIAETSPARFRSRNPTRPPRS